MNPQTAWLVLFVAGLFEVAWAIGLKETLIYSEFLRHTDVPPFSMIANH